MDNRMSIEELKRYYKESADFKLYVDKVCVKEEKTVDQVLEFGLTEWTARYYMEVAKDKLTEYEESSYDADSIVEDKGC